ncbi:MAG TPA: hypothetical protein VMV31_09290 [Terriglobales bacterium]|nr:hypothetical protein [Terriglobales bacterium]
MAEQTEPQMTAQAAELVRRSADPEAAAAGLQRLWAAAPAGVRRELEEDAGLQRAVLTLVASSEFLAEALIQAPELVGWLAQQRREGRAREAWSAALGAYTAALGVEERRGGLMRFKRREYLRIALRDLEGQASLAETTQELSHLAEAVLHQAYVWAWNDLAERFGTPQQAGGGGAELAVLGLGKLGGEELNYSSDIDLMFLYSGEGETAGGGRRTSNHEFFTRLAQAITGYVSAVSREGPAYRVDLRLRPGGREGEVALALGQAVSYYREQARDWELQMLIRARGCAGSRRLAQEFLQAVRGRVYPAAPQAEALAEGVRNARQRISAQLDRHRALRRRGPGTDLKLDAGGIRDIEFLAQYLQRLHGGAEPWVQSGNTLIALQRLHDKGWLRGGEYQRLAAAYWLLRQLEHRLQLRLGQQTHTLPRKRERLAALARSLRQAEGAPAQNWRGEELEQAVAGRMEEVRRVYAHYLGAEPEAGAAAAGGAGRGEAAGREGWAGGLGLSAHGERQWQRLLRSAATAPEAEAGLRGLSAAARARLRLALEASDWMAEALIRRPGLAGALEPGAGAGPAEGLGFAAGMGALRLWHQRASLGLLLEEWEKGQAIGDSLWGHSQLAVGMVQRGLALAREQAPSAPSFAVLALGRLGLGELDLLSDLDLVFVSGEGEREAASRLAAKLIEALTAYTQHGSLYAVDTRLRPGGGEGELVQTRASLAAHFQARAGLWEAISYLKARWVGGDEGTGAAALAGVRAELVRRFAGRMEAAAVGAELGALRERMEREGRPGRWGMKTSAGGYYDVDFLVSRRLLQAGAEGSGMGLASWARGLPEGTLPRAVGEEVARLTEGLRAADHALRVATGKAGSAVAAAGEGVERAWRWLGRIAPAGVEATPAGVDGMRARLRQIYQEWR